MQHAQKVLEEIALHHGSKISPCEDFDPNICAFSQDRHNRAQLIADSGQPLLRKTSFQVGELRARLFANDNYLRIMLFCDLGLGPLSLNRTDKIQALKPAGDLMLGGRTYPVATATGSPPNDGGLFSRAGFLRLLEVTTPGEHESLHFYRNGLAIYLFLPSAQRVGEILEAAAEFLRELPAERPQTADLQALPNQFKPLLPRLQEWGYLDDEARDERRESLPRAALRAIVEEAKSLLPAIDRYLGEFGGKPLTDAALVLGGFAEFVVGTEIWLERTEAPKS